MHSGVPPRVIFNKIECEFSHLNIYMRNPESCHGGTLLKKSLRNTIRQKLHLKLKLVTLIIGSIGIRKTLCGGFKSRVFI